MAPSLMSPADWKQVEAASIPLGDSSGKVTIVEFADFECPYCRSFDSKVRALVAERPGLIARRFVHFPLSAHRFAIPAARAAECAGAEGAFAAMHDRLFDRQDSLGLKSWAAYGRDALVRDTVSLAACTASATTPARVRAGVALGDRLGVNATPTVVINGWRFPVPPSDTLLRESVIALAEGRRPPIVDRIR